MAIKFLQDYGLLNLNIHGNFVVMVTNFDVIRKSSIMDASNFINFKWLFLGLFLAVQGQFIISIDWFLFSETCLSY